MGVADSMDKAMAKNMATTMVEMKKMQIEVGMKNRQMELATRIAMGRERLKYISVLTGTVWLVCPIVAYLKKTPAPLIGMLFSGTSWAMQYDMFYRNLMIRAQRQANSAIENEPERFFLPEGT